MLVLVMLRSVLDMNKNGRKLTDLRMEEKIFAGNSYTQIYLRERCTRQLMSVGFFFCCRRKLEGKYLMGLCSGEQECQFLTIIG